MFDRIISDPAILSGEPIIRGTRISVAMILEWVGSGASRGEIVRKHPHLNAEDLEQALAYAVAPVPTTGPTMLETFDRIHREQQSRGRKPMTEDEMAAEIAQMRAE
jgi:uncharacterized protein (DUF433 family)